ncbi:MAG: SDR family oxidoreductase [Proteobacteria bacterium]|nr:MAG: SDR family oxidoreductase [Pseudomonadota bacterium]
MKIEFNGKVAVITGGSKGLGLAMAKGFAQSGAKLALIARDEKTLKEAAADVHAYSADAKVFIVRADVTKSEEIESAYAQIMKEYGRIDIVVNNVGASAAKPFESITDADWEADFQLKLFSAIRLTRLVWPQMKERKWGRVLNTLATGAKAPAAGSAPSSVTRAAGLALTKVLANEGAADGILVNALLVGLIDSDQWERKAKQQGVSKEVVLAELGKKVPLGRVGTGEEFANLACFLASDAGGYITGTAINVDGGLSPIT